MVLATQDAGPGGRRHRVGRATVGVLLSTAVVCGIAACSWGADGSAQQVSSSVEPEATDEATTSPPTFPDAESPEKPEGPRGGGGSGGSPVAMATAAQKDGLPFTGVRQDFLDEMTANCGGTLCVTVVSEPPEADDADSACTYLGSDPPWREGGFSIPRGSTVVLLADCSPGTGEPGGVEEPEAGTGVETETGTGTGAETGTGTETGSESGGEDVPGDDGEDPDHEGGGADGTDGAP